MAERAVWHDAVLAESDDTIVVGHDHYFPPDALHVEHFRASSTRTICVWMGRAHYYDVVADGAVNADAAWDYPTPTPFARRIRGRVAFWHGVVIESLGTSPTSETRGHA